MSERESLGVIELRLTALVELMEEIESSGSAIPEAVKVELASLASAEDAKVNGIGNLLLRWKSWQADCENQAKEFSERARKLANRQERLKRHVADVLDGEGLKKLEASEVTLTVLDGSVSVDVLNSALVPLEWKREPDPLPPSSDWPVRKGDALRALKDGQRIPGLVLRTGPPTLKVYR